jgi:uncharacterized membrane protein YphA (DoxX/SURF4 family)
MINLGARIYGLAAIVLGLVGLAWGDFAAVWQPVPAGIPHRAILARGVATAFVIAGAALQGRRTARAGALVLAALYAVFALLWARRVLAFPEIFATWSGTAEQLAIATGGVAAWAAQQRRAVGSGRKGSAAPVARYARLVFGLCLLAFGTAHLLYVKETAAMVPAWLPPGQRSWAIATGIFHLLGGLALLSGVRPLLAARLVTLMFVGFGLLVWAPQLVHAPVAHMSWAGNAINFALIGAAWAMADAIGLCGTGDATFGKRR